jgi:DNA-binding transcriptional LysR family regulator
MATRDSYDTLDLKQLKCFWATASLGSLTRAGLELGISESAVVQRVRALEADLGHKLYEARGGRIRLTAAGERVLDMAITLFDEIDDFRRSLETHAPVEPLRLAATEPCLLYLLPEAIARFVRAYPDVPLEVLSRNPPGIVDLVERSEVDLGVMSYEPVPSSLIFRPWQERPGYLIMPNDHPFTQIESPTIHDVLRYPLVVAEPDVGTLERVRETVGELGLDYRIALEVGAYEMVKRYVAIGLGVGVVSGLCLTAADRSTFHAIEIPEEFDASTTYGVLTRRSKHASPSLNRLLASIDPKFVTSTS